MGCVFNVSMLLSNVLVEVTIVSNCIVCRVATICLGACPILEPESLLEPFWECPFGMLPSEDPIYVDFDTSSLCFATAATAAADPLVVGDSLSLPNAEIVTRPCADLRDVHTPPTPSPR